MAKTVMSIKIRTRCSAHENIAQMFSSAVQSQKSVKILTVLLSAFQSLAAVSSALEKKLAGYYCRTTQYGFNSGLFYLVVVPYTFTGAALYGSLKGYGFVNQCLTEIHNGI